ncbi:MAG: hypothetical protein AAFN77_20090 [Planctomycetota bacterium]
MKPVISSTVLGFAITLAGFAGLLDGCQSTVEAQRPVRHETIRSDLPPGLAADYYRMSNRSLANHVQPVQLVTPQGCTIELAGNGTYGSATETKVTVGMMIGPVYRFRISSLPLPGHETDALYPSVEVINRLFPPKGLETEFPIQVALSRDDILQAIEGRMVTKVIYLEDPDGSMPHRHQQDRQPSFDVGGGEDPLRAAEQLGRPMAILRLGSRIPMPNDPTERFDFGSPPPNVLPNPQQGVVFDEDYLQQIRQQPAYDLIGQTDGMSDKEVPILTVQSPIQKIESREAKNTMPDLGRLEVPKRPSNVPAVKFEPVYQSQSRPVEQPEVVRESMGQLQTGQQVPLIRRSTSQSLAHPKMDQVAMAARAQYEAAVAEAALEERVKQVSMQQPVSIEPPAPVIQSDGPTGQRQSVDQEATKQLGPTNLTPRRPDQLNRF